MPLGIHNEADLEILQLGIMSELELVRMHCRGYYYDGVGWFHRCPSGRVHRASTPAVLNALHELRGEAPEPTRWSTPGPGLIGLPKGLPNHHRRPSPSSYRPRKPKQQPITPEQIEIV